MVNFLMAAQLSDLVAFVIIQVKSDSLGLKQPQIRAVNNQSYSSTLLLTQLILLIAQKSQRRVSTDF